MKNSTYSRCSQTVSTVKQVAGHDPGGLLAQEPPPGGGRASRCRIQPVAAQRGPDRGGGDAHAKPQEFALEALVAPVRVLGGQADDQLLDLVVQRRSSMAAMRVGPRAGDQAVMPAPQGVRGDQEARPAVAWQDAADCGEQGAVGGFQPGSWELASQDGELLAQDQDLQVLGGVAAGE
jgi:hypothetical protein